MEQISSFKSGELISDGKFEVINQVKDLNEFWEVINSDVSIFARHRIQPTAFFFSWHLKTVKQWIDEGCFYRINRVKE